MGSYFATYLRALDECSDAQGVLGEEWVIHPPNPDYGYDSTPRNALTFGCMGVDGVHYAILTIDGIATDESPVIQICPMDSEQYQAMGDSFLMFLADSCGVSRETMEELFTVERTGIPRLVAFLKESFDMVKVALGAGSAGASPSLAPTWKPRNRKRHYRYSCFIIPSEHVQLTGLPSAYGMTPWNCGTSGSNSIGRK